VTGDRVELQLAAVLAADVAGYSRLRTSAKQLDNKPQLKGRLTLRRISSQNSYICGLGPDAETSGSQLAIRNDCTPSDLIAGHLIALNGRGEGWVGTAAIAREEHYALLVREWCLQARRLVFL
jgi:hypothetical protein